MKPAAHQPQQGSTSRAHDDVDDDAIVTPVRQVPLQEGRTSPFMLSASTSLPRGDARQATGDRSTADSTAAAAAEEGEGDEVLAAPVGAKAGAARVPAHSREGPEERAHSALKHTPGTEAAAAIQAAAAGADSGAAGDKAPDTAPTPPAAAPAAVVRDGERSHSAAAAVAAAAAALAARVAAAAESKHDSCLAASESAARPVVQNPLPAPAQPLAASGPLPVWHEGYTEDGSTSRATSPGDSTGTSPGPAVGGSTVSGNGVGEERGAGSSSSPTQAVSMRQNELFEEEQEDVQTLLASDTSSVGAATQATQTLQPSSQEDTGTSSLYASSTAAATMAPPTMQPVKTAASEGSAMHIGTAEKVDAGGPDMLPLARVGADLQPTTAAGHEHLSPTATITGSAQHTGPDAGPVTRPAPVQHTEQQWLQPGHLRLDRANSRLAAVLESASHTSSPMHHTAATSSRAAPGSTAPTGLSGPTTAALVAGSSAAAAAGSLALAAGGALAGVLPALGTAGLGVAVFAGRQLAGAVRSAVSLGVSTAMQLPKAALLASQQMVSSASYLGSSISMGGVGGSGGASSSGGVSSGNSTVLTGGSASQPQQTSSDVSTERPAASTPCQTQASPAGTVAAAPPSALTEVQHGAGSIDSISSSISSSQRRATQVPQRAVSVYWAPASRWSLLGSLAALLTAPGAVLLQLPLRAVGMAMEVFVWAAMLLLSAPMVVSLGVLNFTWARIARTLHLSVSTTPSSDRRGVTAGALPAAPLATGSSGGGGRRSILLPIRRNAARDSGKQGGRAVPRVSSSSNPGLPAVPAVPELHELTGSADISSATQPSQNGSSLLPSAAAATSRTMSQGAAPTPAPSLEVRR